MDEFIRAEMFEKWAIEHPDWRELAKKEELLHVAIQLYGHVFNGGFDAEGRRQIDDEAIHHWLGELFSVLDIYAMSEEEKQGIVDRHFANLFAALGDKDENAS